MTRQLQRTQQVCRARGSRSPSSQLHAPKLSLPGQLSRSYLALNPNMVHQPAFYCMRSDAHSVIALPWNYPCLNAHMSFYMCSGPLFLALRLHIPETFLITHHFRRSPCIMNRGEAEHNNFTPGRVNYDESLPLQQNLRIPSAPRLMI
jgi:hypothetical protein